MKRRAFTQYTAIAGSALMLTPDLYPLVSVKKKCIGVQLYSVRDVISKDPLPTIAAIAKMGYEEVEGYGYHEGKFLGLTTAEFKNALSQNGLKVPAFHYMVTTASLDEKTKQLADQVKQGLDTLKEVGVDFVVCPYMQNSDRDSESVKKLTDIFNLAGQACKERGMRFGYHNHDFEFKLEGNRPMIYDLILERTDSDLMDIELDLYWVVFAGQDPKVWIKKADGRVKAFHVKDMAASGETVEVGEGSINFAEIFALPESSSVKYYIVELEHYKRTPLEGVEVSLRNLKKLLNEK